MLKTEVSAWSQSHFSQIILNKQNPSFSLNRFFPVQCLMGRAFTLIRVVYTLQTVLVHSSGVPFWNPRDCLYKVHLLCTRLCEPYFTEARHSTDIEREIWVPEIHTAREDDVWMVRGRGPPFSKQSVRSHTGSLLCACHRCHDLDAPE